MSLQPDLASLSYNELFEQYQAAVACQRDATALDAARIELNIITPLNAELTRRYQDLARAEAGAELARAARPNS